jgi:5'-AMP-activated protein kinase catalytic alpha subunit
MSEAKHDLTGIKVAVKIINKKKMKNKNMISKVKREIKILKFINHPNIIKLYEVLDTTNDIFVIMEIASKGELYDFIQNNEITEEQAKFYFRQIISGVEYVHQNLISHRDLKPENILIDSNNLIKIGDFGLSNLMKDGKLLKTACGSPNYAAPEIVG